MPFAPLPGVDLYYESVGEGPPIVFAHGAGGNHLVWYQQVAFFAPWFRCITFDHRGFGQSVDKSGEGTAAFARDLKGLLDHLEIDRAGLVAQSMGGRSCFPVTLKHPERVTKLVMADTVGGIAHPRITELRGKLRQPPVPGDDRGRGGFAPDYRRRRPDGFMLYQGIAGFNPPLPDGFLDSAGEPVTDEQLAGMTTPVLFIVGDQDTLAPPELIRTASGMVPNSRVELVRGSGHSVYFEKPDVFNHIVDNFLGE